MNSGQCYAYRFINLHIDMEQKFKETNESVLQADLKQWSTQFGVDAATLWPTYEVPSFISIFCSP